MQNLKSFARTISRKLSDRQRSLLGLNSQKLLSDFIAKPFKKFHLEIGFGSGENLIHISESNPELGVIGVEPFLNGAIKVISTIYEKNLSNIFVSTDDVKNIISNFSSIFFQEIFILFPDPWPKKKQQKRRLLSESFLKELLNKTSDKIIFATDDSNYLNYVEKICQLESIHYQIVSRPSKLVISKYEKKAIKGPPTFMEIFANKNL